MPMYQFACESCGQPFEKKLPMSESGSTQSCPSCGSTDTRKRLSAVALGGGSSAPARTETVAPVRRSPFS